MKEKNKEKDTKEKYTKEKNKDNKKFSILKSLMSKNLFKEDKENNKVRQRNSVSKHILSSQMALKKNSGLSTKDIKDMKNLIKPNSDISLNLEKVEEFHKKVIKI